VIATEREREFGTRPAGGRQRHHQSRETNQVRAVCSHYQRFEGLTSKTSDGKPPRLPPGNSSAGTSGGPLAADKGVAISSRLEGVRENLQRPNLSERAARRAR